MSDAERVLKLELLVKLAKVELELDDVKLAKVLELDELSLDRLDALELDPLDRLDRLDALELDPLDRLDRLDELELEELWLLEEELDPELLWEVGELWELALEVLLLELAELCSPDSGGGGRSSAGGRRVTKTGPQGVTLTR